MTSETKEVLNVPLFPLFSEEKLSDYTKGFLEAAIDGEGCVMLIKSKRPDRKTGRVWQPVVKVSNKSRKWLELVAELASGGRIDKVNRNGPNNYLYVMPRHVVKRVLPQLGFVIKERQRVLVLEALKILESHHKNITIYEPERFKRDEERLDEIKAEINYLNRKGESIE